MRALRLVAFALPVVTAGLLATAALGWPYGRIVENGPELWTLMPFAALSLLVPSVVGALIARRQPRNPVAWLLLLGALSTAPLAAVIPSRPWALQWERASWPLLYAWPIAVAFVFPNGRLLSRRWRPVVGVAAFCFVAFTVLAMLDSSNFDAPDESVASPVAGLHVPSYVAWIWVPLWLGILASLFAGAAAVRLRLRRARGRERLQTLWLAWSAALIPLGLVYCGLLGVLGWWLDIGVPRVVGIALFPFLLVMEAAVAASIGIAVVRHRLYAIEVLVNRTLVYATLTLALVATYAAVVLVLGVAAGRGSAWVTAVATLAVALAFRPLRTRVQATVDRRFDRQRYAGVRAVETFEREVREGRRAPEEIGSVVARALGDPIAQLVFWLPASEAYAQLSGGLLEALPEDGRARSEIGRDGERTAVLLHDPSLLERPRLLGGILTAATLSAEIARLRVEVRLQLQEVQASRARIVEAGYEERRRLERDLHDGAQQRLVSLGVRIRRMQRTLPKEARILVPALDGIVDEIGSAIADLRQIAAGVRPARLDDGLAAALHDLARTAPVPVEVEAPLERVAASVEAAAYFVACEALTNAVKHASPSAIAVRASRENGKLLLSVADDGVGGAVARRGSGLAGLKDRVAAHGGRLEISSPEGGGTRIEVALPCES
jgi:signal transduction histidine kinase